jgi:hypothetical protein
MMLADGKIILQAETVCSFNENLRSEFSLDYRGWQISSFVETFSDGGCQKSTCSCQLQFIWRKKRSQS